MNNDNDSFTFSYSNGAKNVTVSFEAETWIEALEEFTNFINAAFGYDIKDKVALKENKYGFNSESWSGPVFNEEML